MSEKLKYTYVVLRYVHDPLVGEFANVGLLMFSESRELGDQMPIFKTKKTIGRMREMFPDLDRSAFVSMLNAAERGASLYFRNEFSRNTLYSRDQSAIDIAKRLIGKSDASLQWSSEGRGITDRPNETFDYLFQRHISLYEQRTERRRTDDEVWRPVREALEERNIPIEFEEKIISSDDDSVKFSHAWKNAAWHVYEPVSFDLADEDGISQKAHRWLGQLTSISHNPAELFVPNLIVGPPEDLNLSRAYEKAISILKKANATVFRESEIPELVNRIEDEVRAHLSHPNP